MKRHSKSCSCTNCAYKSRSKRPSVQQLVADGTKIDKLFYGKYLPLRERKLLEKLVSTRAVYDNVRSRLLSTTDSDQTRSEYTDKSKGYDSSTKKKQLEYFEGGEIKSSNTSKLSSCCNCCSCTSLKKIKESIEMNPRIYKHHVPYESIAKYKLNAERRSKARRRRLGSKISVKMKDIHLNARKYSSDPYLRTLSLSKLAPKKSLKKRQSKRDATRALAPPTSFEESGLEKKNKPDQKLRGIKQSIVNSIESRFKIKKDSLSLFRTKLRKRALKRRVYESYAPEFRRRRRKKMKKSYHRLSGIHVKSTTSSTSKSKVKSIQMKQKPKAKIGQTYKPRRRKVLNQESQGNFPAKKASKLSQYRRRQSFVSSSGTTSSIKTSSKSELVQTQNKFIKPTRRQGLHHSPQSTSSRSLTKNQMDHGLKRCFCTLKLQKKKNNLKKSISKKTMASFSKVQLRDRRDIKRHRKRINTRKPSNKSTPSLITEGIANARHENTQRARTYAKGIEVRKYRGKNMKSQVLKSNKSKPTNTEAFWHRCFCTLKLFNKDGYKGKMKPVTQPENKKKVRLRNTATTQSIENLKHLYEPSELPSFECKPSICDRDQCDFQECEEFLKIHHTRSKNKHSDASSSTTYIHENSKLLLHECDCKPLIVRNAQYQNKQQETDLNARSTHSEVPLQIVSSKTQQTQPRAREKKIKEIELYDRAPEKNIIPNNLNRETVRIGSNFSFNIEFYKERFPNASSKEIDYTSKPNEKQLPKKHFKKQQNTEPRPINVRTRGSQPLTSDSNHVAVSAVPKTKKRNVYIGSAKKTCLCTLKLHKKGKNAKKREKHLLTTKSTKTTLPLFGPVPITSEIKSTNTNKIIRHELKSYECTPGVCIPRKCDPHECYDIIKKRDLKKYRHRHMVTEGRKRRSVLSTTSSEFSNSIKSRSTQSSITEKPQQEHRLKKRQYIVESSNENYVPSRQAIRIGSNFSFSVDFYKDNFQSNIRDQTVPTMYNTVNNFTYFSKVKPKRTKHRRHLSKSRLQENNIIKTNDKVSHISNILKRCFCSLMVQRKEHNRNENKFKVRSISPVITQLTDVAPRQKYRKKLNTLKSLENVWPITGNLKYTSKLYLENNSMINIRSHNGFQAYKFDKSSHSSYDDFSKRFESPKSLLSKFQEYKVGSVLYDQIEKNNNPFYRSYYALNLNVSQMRKVSVLEDDECEPDFCIPYQCDTVKCLERIKNRFKFGKETQVGPQTNTTASMTAPKITSHSYSQADKHSVIKEFHPTKRKTRYGSNMKLNMALYTRSEDTHKKPAQGTPMPPYDQNFMYENVIDNRIDEPTYHGKPKRSRRVSQHIEQQFVSPQDEHIETKKSKTRKLSSLKKLGSIKFKSQDNQMTSIPAPDPGTSKIEHEENKNLKLTKKQTETAQLPKVSLKKRKTLDIRTESAVAKATNMAQEKLTDIPPHSAELNRKSRKTLNNKKEPEVSPEALPVAPPIISRKPVRVKSEVLKSIYARKSNKPRSNTMETEIPAEPINTTKSHKSLKMEPEHKSIFPGKSRKPTNIAKEPETAVLHKSEYPVKSRKLTNVAKEPELTAEPIPKSRNLVPKSVNLEPEAVRKSIHSVKFRDSMKVPPEHDVTHAMSTGKYRKSIMVPLEHEVLPKSPYRRSKYSKLMKVRTDRSSRLARSRPTKMPEELEKFLMKRPRRRVYTIGSSINFSMQFFKEDDTVALDDKQGSKGNKDAGTGVMRRLRCFCTSKRRDAEGNIIPESTKDATAVPSKSKKSAIAVITPSKKSKQESASQVLSESEYSKSEVASEVVSKSKYSKSEGASEVSKSKKSELGGASEVVSKSEKTELEGTSEVICKSKKCLEGASKVLSEKTDVLTEQDSKGKREVSIISGKGSEKSKTVKSKVEADKISKSGQEDKTKEDLEKKKHDKKNICKCKMPICTCKMPTCTCKMPTCTCKMPTCTCKKDSFTCTCEPKSRRYRSKSTKVLCTALSAKSDVLSYDKSTSTRGKRFSKSLYECEPHVCIPGVCDPNVCFKIFKSKRRFKDISISATQELKSKSVGAGGIGISTSVKRCFCILSLKTKEAKNMIQKSFPDEKQNEKKKMKLFQKSLDTVRSMLKKTLNEGTPGYQPDDMKVIMPHREQNGKVSSGFFAGPQGPHNGFDASKQSCPEKCVGARKKKMKLFQKSLDKVRSMQKKTPNEGTPGYQSDDMKVIMPDREQYGKVSSGFFAGPQGPQYSFDASKQSCAEECVGIKKTKKKNTCDCVPKYPDCRAYFQSEPPDIIQPEIAKVEIPEVTLAKKQNKKAKLPNKQDKDIAKKFKKGAALPETKVNIEQGIPVAGDSANVKSSQLAINIQRQLKAETYKTLPLCKCHMHRKQQLERRADCTVLQKLPSCKCRISGKPRVGNRADCIVLQQLSNCKCGIGDIPQLEEIIDSTVSQPEPTNKIHKKKKDKTSKTKLKVQPKPELIQEPKIPDKTHKKKKHKISKSKEEIQDESEPTQELKISSEKEKKKKHKISKSKEPKPAEFLVPDSSTDKSYCVNRNRSLFCRCNKFKRDSLTAQSAPVCDCRQHCLDFTPSEMEMFKTQKPDKKRKKRKKTLSKRAFDEGLEHGDTNIPKSKKRKKIHKKPLEPGVENIKDAGGKNLEPKKRKSKLKEIVSSRFRVKPLAAERRSVIYNPKICRCHYRHDRSCECRGKGENICKCGEQIKPRARICKCGRELKSKDNVCECGENKRKKSIVNQVRGVSFRVSQVFKPDFKLGIFDKIKDTLQDGTAIKTKKDFICKCHKSKGICECRKEKKGKKTICKCKGSPESEDEEKKEQKSKLFNLSFQNSLKRLSIMNNPLGLIMDRKSEQKQTEKKKDTPAICPSCGKRCTTQTVCKCYEPKKMKITKVPDLKKICPVCLKQNIGDKCTCGRPLSSNMPKRAPGQTVCPDCSKQKSPDSSGPQLPTDVPKPEVKPEKKKSKAKKNIVVSSSKPLFSMVIDRTSMTVKNKEETFRHLGVGCKDKDKLQGRYLPPTERRSIDLVIDKDKASVLKPDDMSQIFGGGDKKNLAAPPFKGASPIYQGGAPFQFNKSSVCPFCNQIHGLPPTRTRRVVPTSKEQHDEHCTCCICVDKDGSRVKGHPKNCTCCICRYGCRFDTMRKKTEFVEGDKGSLLKYDEFGNVIVVKKKPKRKKVKKPRTPPVLKARLVYRDVRNFMKKISRLPSVCYCGQLICEKEKKRMQYLASIGLRADVPPPCTCGSKVCKKKHTEKEAYLKAEVKKKKRDRRIWNKIRKKWRKEARARIKKQDAYDASVRKKIKRLDAEALEEIEKYKGKTESWILFGENAADIGRYGINTIRRLMTYVARVVRHPFDAYYRADMLREELTKDPLAATNKIYEQIQASGFAGTKMRVKKRCEAMQSTKRFETAIETTHPLIRYMFYLRHKDPKKRLLRKKPPKPGEVDPCNFFLQSLRKRPCFWVHEMCPWFYPHCLGLLAFWRQFTDIVLFLLAVAVWSPCILAMEVCRTLMCCLMCTGGG